MNRENIEEIIGKIKHLEAQLVEAVEKGEKAFLIEGGKIIFSEEVLSEQKKYMQGALAYIFNSRLLNILVAPVIYAMIVPAVLLDIFMFVYQTVCFPVYKIKKINRKSYIAFDRQKLAYLNSIEKLNCLYCQYFNGLMAYATTEVAAKTELYWCPIKHSKHAERTDIHRYYYRFSDYGEYETLKENWEKNRGWLKEEGSEEPKSSPTSSPLP